MNNPLPRNQSLPLFNPHRPDFICEFEATKVPPIDPQAEAWFQQARELEDPARLDDPDYGEIVRLTRQAAEKKHWKAMLNLASLYVEGRDPQRGMEEAVRLVEEAMELGIPAAYDRMGTYYANGTGVGGDITRAYAFWQKAAEMGNPYAMTFLGEQIDATWDSPADGFWSNVPVATKMLECALSQGYGKAAYWLGADLYNRPGTPEAKALALRTLHEGVKLGCASCAHRLEIEFGDPYDLATMLAPHIDKARAARYAKLGDALNFNPDRRFPNLDAILPLPPAPLPPWNGERKSLLDAAMPVRAKPVPPTPASSQRTGRYHLPATHTLVRSERHFTLSSMTAPEAGWYRPFKVEKNVRANKSDADLSYVVSDMPPGFYEAGEAFQRFRHPFDVFINLTGVEWERWLVIPNEAPAVDPRVRTGQWRQVPHRETTSRCRDEAVCPQTGVWMPMLASGHPLKLLVNWQPFRQAWIKEGDPFPDPQQDWRLSIATQDVFWFLMDSEGVDFSG